MMDCYDNLPFSGEFIIFGAFMDHVLFAGFTVADAAVALLLFLFALWKGKKGFYECFMPFVVAVCAFVGALLLTRLLREAVTDWVWPWVLGRMREKLDLDSVSLPDAGQITDALGRLLPPRVLNLTEKLGLDLSGYVRTALDTAAGNARDAASNAAEALLRAVTEEAVKALLFLLLWGLLALLLTLAKNALGLVFHLPLIHGLNGLLGAVFGLLQCAVLLYALIWLAYVLNLDFLLRFIRASRILQGLTHLQL